MDDRSHPYLAGMMTVGRVKTDSGWQYQISVDPKPSSNCWNKLPRKVNQSSKNARFYFDDASRQLVLVAAIGDGPHPGLTATRDAVTQGLLQGQHDLPLVLTVAKPAVADDATAASLGITGLVQEYTSYFRGSGAARLQNIDAARKQFYGLLVPPNSTFSMGQAIGDISLDNGYAEALIIYNGQTITGVGGGVCQVSTTLFRTAFFGWLSDRRTERACISRLLL